MVLLTRAGECDSTDPARPLNCCSTSRPPPHRPRRAWTGGILAITKSIRARFRACCVNSSVPCRRSIRLDHPRRVRTFTTLRDEQAFVGRCRWRPGMAV